MAEVATRTVRRLSCDVWNLKSVLESAASLASTGSVLVTFDVPLGVPSSYLSVAQTRWESATDFLRLIEGVAATEGYFEATTAAHDWRINRPFFTVPPGVGGLTSYHDAARKNGVELLRNIDRRTGARSLFAKAGIPGSVGSAAAALWTELGRELSSNGEFSIWPFEGSLEDLSTTCRVAVAEIYPRAAYATALSTVPAHSRPRLSIPKTDDGVRADVVSRLPYVPWILDHSVTLVDLDFAESNEDDFDACLTAAALLRCAIEGAPMSSRDLTDPIAEGGILGTGSINLDLPESALRQSREAQVRHPPERYQTRSLQSPSSTTSPKVYACPIPGCLKIFQGSRGGWDGHVGSIRLHPWWHPEVSDPEGRKELFIDEFPEFFG
jgi:hypothetical protein